MKVANKKCIRRLTWRAMKAKRLRNYIAVLAIALTSLMFTVIFTIGSGVIQTVEQSTFRQVGTSAHGGLKYLTLAEYDKVLQSNLYQDISFDIIVGFAENPELMEKQHEVRYSEDKKAKWGFSYPTAGTMPQNYDEVAVSTITLDMLKLPYQLGQSIPLIINGTTQNLTLVGYWPGDDVMTATQCYISKALASEISPMPEAGGIDNYIGSIQASLWFKNSYDIEAKLDALLAQCNFDRKIDIGVNWGYTASGQLDMTSLFLLALILFVILLAGYLIIYSIFAISVSGDIQFYGLLKTIGTTGRQIRQMVRGQALLLSTAGIPLGLISGFYLGVKLAPVAMRLTSYDLSIAIRANPLIFIFSAVFSVVTVFISCQRPSKLAAKVSAIEALRFTENDIKKKPHKTRRVTPFSMAAANVGRSKRKLITIVLSLSLSLVLLNTTVAIIQSFDIEQYVKNKLISDFYITDANQNNAAIPPWERNFEAVSDEFIEKVTTLSGVEDYGRVFFQDHSHYFTSDQVLHRFGEIVGQYTDKTPYMAQSLESAMEDRLTYLQVYGLDKLAFENLEENYQKISWEKFSSGNYALIATFDESDNENLAFYQIGEKVILEGAEYEILGYMSFPYAISCQFTHLIGTSLVLSADGFEKAFGKTQAFSLLLNVQPSHLQQTQQWLSENTNKLLYLSRSYFEAEFSTMQHTYMILGGMLALILALIGILNFVNTITTSIMTRRRELAMLQGVGMTGRQLKQMLFGEGLCYAMLTLLFSLTIGAGLSALLAKGIAGEIWFFDFHFSLKPVILCSPVLLVLCACIPLVCAAVLQRESVVDRLRDDT